MDNENAIRDVDRARLQSKDDVNVQENKSDTYPNILDVKADDRVGTSKLACTSPHCTDTPGFMVEELTVKNLNRGKSEIVSASKSNPGVWEDSDSSFFSQFLDKRQDPSQHQNETTDNLPQDEKLISPGGIRTKILSKSGFSEYFVKNTLQGKGVTFKGPARDGVGVQIRGQSDSRDIISIPELRPSISPSNEGTSLREWLNGGSNKVDKSKSLYIFKQILDLVDSSHSRGVALQALRPSSFRLLPSNNVLYLGSPTQKDLTEIHYSDNQDGKKRKFGEKRNSFGRWPQFPNRSASDHGSSNDVAIGGDLLEKQWYAKERCSTLSSNIYSLGVLLFEVQINCCLLYIYSL